MLSANEALGESQSEFPFTPPPTPPPATISSSSSSYIQTLSPLRPPSTSSVDYCDYDDCYHGNCQLLSRLFNPIHALRRLFHPLHDEGSRDNSEHGMCCDKMGTRRRGIDLFQSPDNNFDFVTVLKVDEG